jgi:hypothetical protein
MDCRPDVSVTANSKLSSVSNPLVGSETDKISDPLKAIVYELEFSITNQFSLRVEICHRCRTGVDIIETLIVTKLNRHFGY